MAPIYNALNYDNLHLMNDDERATFNYLYAKEGESAAKEYLEYLQYELNRRSSEFWNDGAADLTKKNAFTQVVGSLLSTAIALTGGKAGQGTVLRLDKAQGYRTGGGSLSWQSARIWYTGAGG
jgi:hypothetical protein